MLDSIYNRLLFFTLNELIHKLKSLGFTDYESKIFLALLLGHTMSASEIAEAAKIRRTDVYGVLRSFVEKGYCNEIETSSISKFEMIDPDIIFDKIELKVQQEKEKHLTSLKDTFKTLKPLYRSKETEKNKSLKRI